MDINESLNNIRIELTKKVFNSRVNEFMEAQKELDLESRENPQTLINHLEIC